MEDNNERFRMVYRLFDISAVFFVGLFLHNSQNKLESIDMHLKDVTDKLAELRELDKRIKYVGPKLDTIVQRIEQSSQSTEVLIDDDIKRNIEYLMNYINDDIDE